jgi:hypothetical protein
MMQTEAMATSDRHPTARVHVQPPRRPGSPVTGSQEDAGADTDAVQLLDDVPLTEDEADYVEAARAANTMRGYRSDWREFTAWCTSRDLDPLPAAPATITGYLTELAQAGAKVGTMSRRLSALKFAHQLRNLPDPTTNARVVALGGHSPHPRRTLGAARPPHAAGALRRRRRLPGHQGVGDQEPCQRAGPGRCPRPPCS